MISFVSVTVLSIKLGIVATECIDIYGRSITPNTHFIPGPDICQLCVCDNTSPKWCKRVLCSPPQNCKSFVMGSSCCDYSCLDNTLPSGELRDEIDRRFLITIATAFVILSVLLFIIHKLRFRTIHGRLQNRQVNEDRRSLGSIGFITGSIGYLNLPNGHHFDDHPLVHFPIYKPNANYFPRGEAPPPYEEAVADTALNVAFTSQLLTNERGLQELNQQRRRSVSTGMDQVFPSRIITDESCVCEPRQVENGIAPDVASVYNCMAQHRTIPLPICVNADQANGADVSLFANIPAGGRLCPVHKKGNVMCRSEFGRHHRGRANSASQQRACVSNGRPNTCPPQFHFEASHVADPCAPPQHRTLPLSASLSSPLPSTSDSSDRQCQFGGATPAPAYSSAVNICSSESNEQTLRPAVAPLAPSTNSHHSSCRKLSSSAVDTGDESQSINAKEKKSNAKSSVPKERVPESASKEPKEESQETCQLVEDYYAECENCNLNVTAGCDGSDEYFAQQETMTLQRKLHEASAAKNNDQTMKVSLTLPTNSRTRRCSSKNRKCGPWSANESPFKTRLEYVSSAEEDEEEAKEKVKEEQLQEKPEPDKNVVQEMTETTAQTIPHEDT